MTKPSNIPKYLNDNVVCFVINDNMEQPCSFISHIWLYCYAFLSKFSQIVFGCPHGGSQLDLYHAEYLIGPPQFDLDNK